MRKLKNLSLIGVVIHLSPTLTAQNYSNPNVAFQQEASALFPPSQIEALLNWFNSPMVETIAWIILISSLGYCLAYLILLTLINKEVFSVKNSILLQEIFSEVNANVTAPEPKVPSKQNQSPIQVPELAYEERIQALEKALQAIRFSQEGEHPLNNQIQTG